MQKFKIVLRQNELDSEQINSNLSFDNGYLFYDISEIKSGSIVDENNIIPFLNNENNKKISDRFFEYLKKNTTKTQFLFLKNNARKLFIIFNDFYTKTILNRDLPNFILIKNALEDTKVEYYRNYYFNFETNNRFNNKNKKIIELKFNPEEGDEIKGKQQPKIIPDYYLNIYIDVNQKEIPDVNYSKYVKKSIENGEEFVDSFINLNKKINPFDIWNDNVGKEFATEVSSNVQLGLLSRLRNIK